MHARISLLTLVCLIGLVGCAWMPFKKSVTLPDGSTLPTAEAAATPGVDADRAEALRNLPPGTVVLEEKPPGFFAKIWRSVFKPKPQVPVAAPPLWIGVIRVVNADEKYVLIDSPQASSMRVGDVLNSVGNDFESGTVRVTADKNPPFFIADVVSGNPAVGDRLYSPR